jgi:hypothetical protein
MGSTLRRLGAAAIGISALLALPATAAADCNGPGCEPMPPVEGAVIVMTVAVVLTFFAILVAAEARRR